MRKIDKVLFIVSVLLVLTAGVAFAEITLSEPPTHEEIMHLLCHGLAGLISGSLIAYGIINNL